jgi:ribosome-associated toxin RatA of RatAB toxin-antitoxin module
VQRGAGLMPELRLSCDLPVASYALWPALLDMERNAAGLPAVRTARVVSTSDNQRITEWCLLLRGAPLWWQQCEDLDPHALSVTLRLVRGDPKRISGHWWLEPSGDRTTTHCDLDFDFGFARIAAVLNVVLRETISTTLSAFAEAAVRSARTGGSSAKHRVRSRLRSEPSR